MNREGEPLVCYLERPQLASSVMRPAFPRAGGWMDSVALARSGTDRVGD
jgi:hypothetical protein